MPRTKRSTAPHNTTFPCQFCDKSFRWKSSLDAHLVIHSEERKFICPVCKKDFSWSGSLKRHLLTHSDAKNFSCSGCGKAFKEERNLKKHQREVHEKIKLFKCTICDKAFARKDHLQKHEIVHTGSKNYKCRGCGMLFTQLGNVYRHQRDTCKSDSAIIANTHVSPGGKVTTSTTHTMVISPDLATVVTRFPDATVTKQKHPGATVTTVLPERATVSERQGLHPTTDLPPAAINDMTQGQLTDPLEGDLSDLPNINPTTSILFDAGDIGGIDGIDGIDDIDDIDDIDFGLDYNLPGILEFSD